ncbi:MAG: hypothetical protein AB7L76_22460, partial [Burkholderiaceae bacterium]
SASAAASGSPVSPDSPSSAMPPSAAATASAPLLLAPSELLRYAQRAAQVGGLSFGASLEAAAAADFAQRIGGNGLQALVTEVETADLRPIEPARVRGGSWHTSFDAGDRSLLAVACEAFDAACRHAARTGVGLAVVDCRSGHALFDAWVLRAARRGLLAIAVGPGAPVGPVTPAASQPVTHRCIASGPDRSGPWFAIVETDRPSTLQMRLEQMLLSGQARPPNLPSWLAASPAAAPDAILSAAAEPAEHASSGLARLHFLCVQAGEQTADAFAGLRRAIEQRAPTRQSPRLLDGAALSRLERSAETSGLRVDPQQWQALLAAAARILVSPDDEVTLRPEGLDPQRYL